MVEGEGERDGECASERSYMIERERERAHTQLAIHDREKGKWHTHSYLEYSHQFQKNFYVELVWLENLSPYSSIDMFH